MEQQNISMPSILAKSFMRPRGNLGDQKKLEVLAHLERLESRVLLVPNQLIFQAAEYKAKFPISSADCIALASALEYEAAIVTCDPDFSKVQHRVEILWV
jgi:ribonuclease VapC